MLEKGPELTSAVAGGWPANPAEMPPAWGGWNTMKRFTTKLRGSDASSGCARPITERSEANRMGPAPSSRRHLASRRSCGARA